MPHRLGVQQVWSILSWLDLVSYQKPNLKNLINFKPPSTPFFPLKYVCDYNSSHQRIEETSIAFEIWTFFCVGNYNSSEGKTPSQK